MKQIRYDLPRPVIGLWQLMNNQGHETRLVGGAVRDLVMGHTPKDYDFCTTATPEQMVAFAEKWGYRVEPTGMQHGTVSFILDGVAYEFTTLRIDTDCDGRHASVQFTTDFEADAARRDFTMNAMSADRAGRVYDYFGGWDHIEEGVVKFVGKPKDRIREDFLRILRFFRFAARFNAGMEWEAIKFICTDEAHEGLKKISRERIWAEVSKIAECPVEGRESAMVQMGLTRTYGAIGMVPNTKAQAAIQFAKDAPSFMAGFCGDRNPENFGRAWKMSNDEIKVMAYVAEASPHWGTTDMISELLDGISRNLVKARVNFFLPGMTDDEFTAVADALPVFTVTGQDLINEGFKPGPEMGQELKRRRAAWKQQFMENR